MSVNEIFVSGIIITITIAIIRMIFGFSKKPKQSTVVREQPNHRIPETRLSAGQAGFAWYKVDKVESYLKSINDNLAQWRADSTKLMQILEKIEREIK